MISCSVEDCNKPVKATGLCGMHHQRRFRYGSVHTTLHASPGLALATVDSGVTCTSDDCLIWPHARSTYGYGYVTIDGRARPVHQEVCQRVHGPKPGEKHEVAHSCGNGHLGCFNGCHLRWATTKENAEDRIRHGTTGAGGEKPWSRGEKNNHVKLTETEVRAIRKCNPRDGFSELAREYGVNPSTISRIAKRKTWAWLT